jgi:hypothetical protein
VRVAEIARPDPAEAVLLEQRFEGLAERVRVDQLAVLLGYDEVVVVVVEAPLGPLLVLALPVRSELGDRLGVEVDHAGAEALWRRMDDLAAYDDERLPNRERSPRSMSCQRRPRISSRRMPVIADSRQIASRRVPPTAPRKWASSSGCRLVDQEIPSTGEVPTPDLATARTGVVTSGVPPPEARLKAPVRRASHRTLRPLSTGRMSPLLAPWDRKVPPGQPAPKGWSTGHPHAWSCTTMTTRRAASAPHQLHPDPRSSWPGQTRASVA